MDLMLRGKTALVTGASKGLGYAAAERLAEEGCSLRLVARSQDLLDKAAAELTARHGVEVRTRVLDLAKVESIEMLDQEARETDILVNNAGAIPLGSIEEVDDQRWRESWDLKVFGYINLTRKVYGAMKARRAPGVIINIIGHAGENLSANYLAGTSGCAALMALTRALGAASPEVGIRVVGINPGAVLTERLDGFIRRRAEQTLGDAERWPELVRNMPFGRTGKPSEIADAVAFLASERSGYTTGTILTIDGGISSRANSWL
ncbi:short-chain dehydrogenase/reductase [Enterovirga sp.]|jgi:3-oxoacyl-[acyl-carrier protein] reductase|uniref:short-chain dehydrogenase/reductase n=1 Tax=Enterovirga sp. TaxID=2026350 RepID=UPI00261C5EE5|nr:short-chain dehydrogenase/reductase [Enterovirga sp.]MDB5591610.1 short-chain dehydrogenase [Enterovirga sp.]